MPALTRIRQPAVPARWWLILSRLALAVAAVLGLLATGCRQPPPAAPGPSPPAQVSARLLAYREFSQIDTGLAEPRGLALGPGGNVYVVGDKALRVFASNGSLLSQTRLSAEPTAVAVAADGTAYLALLDHMEVYNPQHILLASWPSAGDRAYFTSVAVAGNDVFVGDAGDRVVLHYDKAGQILGRIGRKDSARKIPGLIVPSPHLDVAVDAQGLLHVNNPGRLTVETYTVAGDLKSSWGRSSFALEDFCGCCNPTDIALMPDGKIVTSEKGIPRVKIYRPDGTLDSVVAEPRTFSPGVVGLDLAVDRNGHVLVLDPVARIVRIFERREKPLS